MATYLQGVTDYIPEFQPFQPDLNFYSNLLQLKQTQYDTNWKAINKIYGQYFYADLSRQDNMQIKDELMKNIDFNLKRTSGLDLSLEQNVEQAAQVFKPFYEDKFLMKDMAYTKNYLNQRNRGLSLKNAKDAVDREQYWDTGIKALDYQREEFRNVSREDTLNIGSTTYTPYVNAIDKYGKVAKDWGISADMTTPDPSGMYMIRQKNGDLILPTLQTLFQSYGANDPQLQQVYFTQAYVNRKDAVYQNAQKFNGDLNAAERDYLNQASKTVSDYAAKRKAEADRQNTAIKNEQERTTDVIKKNEDNIFTNQYLDRLNQAAGFTEAAAEAADKVDKEVNNYSYTDTTTGGSYDMSEDVEELRRKVDAGIASMLMDADINTAAYAYSRKDMKYEMKESQAGLESIRQKNRLAAISAKQKADEWNIKLKHNLDSGIWLLDEAGNPYPKDLNYYNPNPINAAAEEDEETGEKTNIDRENKFAMDEIAQEYSKDWVESAMNLVEEKYKDGLITKAEYNKFFSLDWSETNYASAREAGKDILNKAAGQTVSTGKGIISKLVKGFGIDQRVTQLLGEETGRTFKNWLDKDDTKAKTPNDKQEEGTVTKILDTLGITAALGQLYYKSPTDFYDDYKKDPSSFLYGNAESLGLIKAKVDALAGRFRGDGSSADNYINNTLQSGQKMDKFIMHANAVKAINLHNQDVIQEQLMSDPKLYDIVKGDKGLVESLTRSFYDGNTLISKDNFKELVKKKLNLTEDNYYLYGTTVSNRAFETNKLTRAELVESIFSKESNLSKIQKNELIDKILYAQKQRAKQKETEKEKLGAFNTQEELTPIQNIVNDYLDTLNNSDKYAASIYDNMMRVYNKTVQDPSKIQILTPLLQDVTGSGGRAAQYARGESGVEVHLGAPSTFKPFVEFVQNDLRNIKFGDINNTAISILGTSKSAFDKSKERTNEDGGAQRDMLNRIVYDLYAELRQNSKVKPFRFAQRQIAAENRNLGAMVLYPDKEFLDKYKAGKDEPGLSADDINNMLRYGISVIAPRQNFTNTLFKQNFWTPMQVAVKSSPNKTVTLSNPFGAGKINIGEVKMGPGDYSIEFITNELKPDGSIKTRSSHLPNQVYGNNLDNQAQIALEQLMIVSAQNNNIYQTLSPELKKKVSQSEIFKNIPVSMIPILQNAWDLKQTQRMILSK